MRLGITIPLDGFHNRNFLELVRHAEKLGFTDAWTSETNQNDAFSPIAVAAGATEQLRLGTAIVPVFTRPAAQIAMTSAWLQLVSEGRFVLGLGVSTPTVVEQWMGIPYERPLTRIRETVSAIRSAFADPKVTFEGKTIRSRGFRLDLPLRNPPPIYIGAQGARMLRASGEIGDGTIVNFVTPEALPGMLAHVREGARSAGKPDDAIDVVCRIVVAVDHEIDMVREQLRRELTAYLTVPQYNQFFREIGYEDIATTALEAWQGGDRKRALQTIPEEMIESIYVFGTPEQWMKRLGDYAKAGITTTALKLNSYAKTPEEKRARVMRAMEVLAGAW